MLLPRQPFPDLHVPTLAHGDVVLSADAAPRSTRRVVYRGLHCPINFLIAKNYPARGEYAAAV